MISPKAVAEQYNRALTRASDSSIEFSIRQSFYYNAKTLYYVLTGVGLTANFNEYYNMSDFVIDNKHFSELEVDNYTGERYRTPIRRFLTYLFNWKGD